MARKRRQNHISRLDKAKFEFASWRKGRKGRSRIPAELWRSAAEAAGQFGISAVSKALRLDYHALKKRMTSDDVAPTTPSRSVPSFVELDAAGLSPFLTEWVVEIEDGRGARMRISAKGPGNPDTVSLCRTFREMNR